MDKLITSGNMTMSSREIAELTGSTHDNVLKTVRGLRDKGIVSGNETPYVHPQNGQTYHEFLLSYRDTMVVVSGYSVELRAKIIDRWQELENAAAKPAPVELTRMELLQLAMAAEKEKLELVAKLEEQAPKVEIVDRIAEATNTLCIRDAAKTLQVQPSKLTQWLLINKWIYHRPGKKGYLAYQDKLQNCYLVHKSTPYHDSNDGEEKISEQVRITGRGLTLIAQKLNEGGIGIYQSKPNPPSQKPMH